MLREGYGDSEELDVGRILRDYLEDTDLGSSEDDAPDANFFGPLSPLDGRFEESDVTRSFGVILLKSFTEMLPKEVTAPRPTTTHASLRNLVEQYGVPRRYTLRAPSSVERVFSNRTGELTLHSFHFETGLRLPLAPDLRRIFSAFYWAPCQWDSSAMRAILCFIVICRLKKVVPDPLVFGMFFHTLRSATSTRTADGFIPVRMAPGVEPFMEKIPDAGRSWRREFFFVRSSVDTEWDGLVAGWRPSPMGGPFFFGREPKLNRDHPTVRALYEWRDETEEVDRCWDKILVEENFIRVGLWHGGDLPFNERACVAAVGPEFKKKRNAP